MKRKINGVLVFVGVGIFFVSCSQKVVKEAPLEEAKPLITLEIYATTNSENPQGSAKKVLGSDKMIYLVGKPVLTAGDLKKAALMDGYASKYAVLLEFNEEGAAKLEAFSRENLQKVVAIVVDGDVLTAPLVQEEIVGGKSMISRPFKEGEAEEIVRKINQVLAQKEGK